jgi:ABC-type Fe3+ transport system permease subunit
LALRSEDRASDIHFASGVPEIKIFRNSAVFRRAFALFHVLLPVSRPGIIAVAVFSFIFSWNEYLFPLILVNNEAAKTLPLGVAGFMGHLNVEWGPLLAAADYSARVAARAKVKV